jgi:hypothetical protein
MFHGGYARAIKLIATIKQGDKAANCSKVYCVLRFTSPKSNSELTQSYAVASLSPTWHVLLKHKASNVVAKLGFRL